MYKSVLQDWNIIIYHKQLSFRSCAKHCYTIRQGGKNLEEIKCEKVLKK